MKTSIQIMISIFVVVILLFSSSCADEQVSYEQFVLQSQEYLARIYCVKRVAILALANMDGYITQMEDDRAVLVAAGGNPSIVDECLKKARAERDEAYSLLYIHPDTSENDSLKCIDARVQQIESLSLNVYDLGRDMDIDYLMNDAIKILNVARTYLKKIVNLDGLHPKTCEEVVRQQYEKAVNEIEQQFSARGLNLSLPRFTPVFSTADAFDQGMAAINAMFANPEADSH